MSVTNEVKVAKKRGRPKKIKEELPVVPQASTQEQARKAVEEILSQASARASSQTALVEHSPVSIEGAKTGASSHDNLADAQDDYIPGTRNLDIQMVPRRAYDENLGRSRQVGLPNDYHYCWVHESKITSFRINGYKFVGYNGGTGSGVADGGFSGTGIFEKTFDNHVRNGDMLLMWCSLRQHEAMTKDINAFRDSMEGSAEGEIHNEGYRRGIRTFKEVDGVLIYN